MTENSSPDDPRNTPFTSILFYVLGFLAVLALLAFAAAWMLRLLSGG